MQRYRRRRCARLNGWWSKAIGEAPFPRVAQAPAKLLRAAPQKPGTKEESLDVLEMTRVPKKDGVSPLSKPVVGVSGNVHGRVDDVSATGIPIIIRPE